MKLDDYGIYRRARGNAKFNRLNNGMMLTIHCDTYCERVNGMLEIKK